MSIVIHSTTVVTADPDRSVHHGAAIAVEGDRIAAIGPSDQVLARFPDAERIDGRGKAVMPGFANCHTHFVLTLARGIFEDLSHANTPPFHGLVRLPLPELAPEERVVIAQLGALEALRSGTTAVMEVAQGIGVYAQALVDTGLRLVLAEQASDRAHGGIGQPGVFEVDPKRTEDGLQRIADLHATWNGANGGRVTVAVAAHAPDMVSPELLRGLRDLQERLDTISTIHLSQLWGEVESVKANRGVLPTDYLAQNGFLHQRLVAAHCRCMEPPEVLLLGESGAFMCFNSAIAARRGLSPRVADLERAGCTIAMGSDNMAEDMVEVMRTGMFMERVRTNDGRAPTPEDVLQWATANGYRALGLEGAGCLQEGNKADLIVVRTQLAHLVPTMRIVSSFVHQGQGRDIEAVMVDGRWLLRNGKVLTMDEERIVREAERIGRAAWRRLFEEHPDLEVPPGLDTTEPPTE
ncbi:MAG: amidohydrolase family protein [Dehalococcoidia bacterium]